MTGLTYAKWYVLVREIELEVHCCFSKSNVLWCQQVATELSDVIGKGRARVADFCCGVGTSTRALTEAFNDAEVVIGLDSSPEMLAMANFLSDHLAIVKPYFDMIVNAFAEQGNKMKVAAIAGCASVATFLRGNAEDTKLPARFFDLVTIMYAFHEAPKNGRDKILQEARRVLRPGGTLAIVDISSDYAPPKSMLMGEPYVLEYQKNIHRQLESLEGFFEPTYKIMVPGHVGMWVLQRAPVAVPV